MASQAALPEDHPGRETGGLFAACELHGPAEVQDQVARPCLAWGPPSFDQKLSSCFLSLLPSLFLSVISTSKKQSLDPLKEDAECGPSQPRHLPLQA